MKKIALFIFPILLISLALFYVNISKKSQYDFNVESADGNVTLDSFKGKVLAIYFGYTHCPDICPTSLSTLASAVKMLTPEEAKDVQVLFVSVDSFRDTPSSLKEYVEYFYPTFIGATAPKEIIDEMVGRFDGTKYTITKDDKSAMRYSVGHTSFVYFFNRDGKLVSILNHSIDPQESVTYFKEALNR